MELIDALFDLCKDAQRPIIAIDGPAGAGKTTLAEHLSAALSLHYRCTTLHMDELYNGWENPFDHHFVDALTGAVNAHRHKKSISLSRYNWHTSSYGPVEVVPSAELLIVEGVASFHPAIRPHLTASIWIDIEPTHGLKRVLIRDGESISPQMQKWLATQEEFFSANQSKEGADFLLTN